MKEQGKTSQTIIHMTNQSGETRLEWYSVPVFRMTYDAEHGSAGQICFEGNGSEQIPKSTLVALG